MKKRKIVKKIDKLKTEIDNVLTWKLHYENKLQKAKKVKKIQFCSDILEELNKSVDDNLVEIKALKDLL